MERYSIPDKLDKEIDNSYEELGFATKSELVRYATRKYMSDKLEEKDPPVTTINTIDKDGIEYGISELTEEKVLVDVFNSGGSNNVFVCGNIGSGKTFSQKVLLSRYIREYGDNINVVLIDPLEGYKDVCEAFDGNYVNNYNVNIMQLTEPNVDVESIDLLEEKTEYVVSFISSYIKSKFETEVTELIEIVIRKAILRIYEEYQDKSSSMEQPSIIDVIDEIPKVFSQEILESKITNELPGEFNNNIESKISKINEIHNQLKIAAIDGRMQKYNQQTNFSISEDSVTYIDTQIDQTGLDMWAVLENVYRQSQEIDKPTIIVVDEFRYVLQWEELHTTIEQLFRHSRHYDISLQVLEQGLHDLNSNIHHKLVNNCKVSRLFRTDMIDQYDDPFNLNKKQKHYLSIASPGMISEEQVKESQQLLVSEQGVTSTRFRLNSVEKELFS